jgi:hypothetical protein
VSSESYSGSFLGFITGIEYLIILFTLKGGLGEVQDIFKTGAMPSGINRPERMPLPPGFNVREFPYF